MHLRIVDICAVCCEHSDTQTEETLRFVILGRGLEKLTEPKVRVKKVDHATGTCLHLYTTINVAYIGRGVDWQAALVTATRPWSKDDSRPTDGNSQKDSEELEVTVTTDESPKFECDQQTPEPTTDTHSIPFPAFAQPLQGGAK